jgi:hypothetical protein
MVKSDYSPYRLWWTKSYEEEVSEFRRLILSNPEDVDLLKDEYKELTGKRFRRKSDES